MFFGQSQSTGTTRSSFSPNSPFTTAMALCGRQINVTVVDLAEIGDTSRYDMQMQVQKSMGHQRDLGRLDRDRLVLTARMRNIGVGKILCWQSRLFSRSRQWFVRLELHKGSILLLLPLLCARLTLKTQQNRARDMNCGLNVQSATYICSVFISSVERVSALGN